MRLKKGILIHNQMQQGYDAVSINSGTVLHTGQITEPVNFNGVVYTPQYEDHAYVAKRDWRSLDPAEMGCLRAKERRNDYNTVYLGDIPEALKENFKKINLAGSKNREEVFTKFSGDAELTKELSTNLNSFLKPLADDKPFNFHCIGTTLPNIEMLACNTTKLPSGFKPQDIRYMGMHNDGTQEMTIHTAHQFGNRISINLGNDTRSFLFVNLSMIQALNMIAKKIGVEKNKVNIANIPKFFFEHFPDYPVIRVQQKPYQYYIAPTDNCFHDGSTLGNKQLDITMVYFGAFRC
ncbi:hypothetical protein TH53_20040 [Pedobacter lusitanus]|uniref:Uncharacterized protein n=1 Tax=Pedobacter lusitanus TaxID=1503925 RepID=A0A0D0F1N3_9SPHI|nr:hypothetical protein [Pedobacter lusitanus]KIO75543.1 hypothetical protein TH53_20040 [Pedobacter lusitanus]